MPETFQPIDSPFKVVGIWGEDKTGKSTLALTFPKPMLVLEIDVGGFDRAVNPISVGNKMYHWQDLIKSGDITIKNYAMPFQTDQISNLSLGERTLASPSRKVKGMRELYYRLLQDYMDALDDPNIQTIVVDTGTLLWELTTSAYLQELQEKQFDQKGNLLPGEKMRVQLQQIEYKEPNIRMRAFIYQSKVRGKFLIMTHHASDEYGQIMVNGSLQKGPTGKRAMHGWNSFGDGADMIVQCFVKKVEMSQDPKVSDKMYKPFCKVELTPVFPMKDMEIMEPTYETLVQTMDMVSG